MRKRSTSTMQLLFLRKVHFSFHHFTMTDRPVIIGSGLNSNSDYSLQWNRWFLKPIGAWPPSSSTTKFEKAVALVLNIICYGFILFTLIPCILHMLLEDNNFYKKMKVFGPVSHWFIGGINYTTLLLRSKDIRECVDHMRDDWRAVARKRDQEVMLKSAKFGRYVAIFCGIIFQGGIICYCVITSLGTQIIEIGNQTKILHMLPCAVYDKLIVVDGSPMYEIVLITQMVSIIIVNSSVVGILSLAAVLAAHACGQLNVLMIWITEFVNEPRKQNKITPFKKVGVIVEHHLRVLDFISHIEETMNRTCFLELFRCIVAICVLGYYILAVHVEWADRDAQSLTTYFVILIAMSFHSYMICYIGDLLTEQCKNVGEAVYMTNWYYLPDKNILDLMLIIARSHMVVQLTAGKLVNMSVYTFGDVIKTGFAYLNLLNQMT